jgi:hypothetical protein
METKLSNLFMTKPSGLHIANMSNLSARHPSTTPRTQKLTMETIVPRKANPNALRCLQQTQATDLLEHCTAFHIDYDALKYEFAPSRACLDLHRFEDITGKDDIGLALLREKIIYLVEATKETLEGSSDATHADAIRHLNGHLQGMIRKTRDLKMALEGEGHKYQHGKPRFLVIGASKEPEEDSEMEGKGAGHSSDSSGPFQLESAESSFDRGNWSCEESSDALRRKRDWAEFLNERRLVSQIR